MPFRQSTLNFALKPSTSLTALPQPNLEPIAEVSLRQFSSSSDTDTIVVNTNESDRQLPTPSETATDVSSQSSQSVTSIREVSRSRSRRVSPTRTRKSVFEEDLRTLNDAEQDKSRSVSGETLVAEKPFSSPSSILQKGVAALNLPWSMSDTFLNGSKADLLKEDGQDEDQGSSVITVREDSEEERNLEEQRQARQIKMRENAKKWEQRKKAAEKNATRRSGRASLVSKASDLLSNIKGTVLGKRPRNTEEEVATKLRSQSNVNTDTPSSKKRKMSEDDVVEEPVRKTFTTRREKKWLTTGLFAGQARMFDARLNENKNKRKSDALGVAGQKDNKVMPLPMFAGERLLQNGRDFKLPFDIFSPLPAGQPKPDEWKKVNKNVFVGDAAAEWRSNKFVEHSTCLCKPSTGCDQDCMNRYMYYECDEHNCNLDAEECGNRAFEGLKSRAKIGGKFNVGVEVIKTVDRGYGVRSNRTFMPNQIIVEYTGEIITQEECEQRMRTIYKNNECYYLMLFDQNMIIDATRGSMARFVNHSCEPNCRMEKWTVGGKPRMALFAGDHGIMTGEELTYDYNFDPYSQKNVQECRCGAKNCRGVLGPKPKPEAKRNSPEEEVKRKKESKLTGAKRKMAEVMEETSNKLNKKQKTTSPKSKKAAKSPKESQKGKPKTKMAILVKKSTTRKVSMPKTTSKIGRSDSKLKTIVSGVKQKAGSIKRKGGKRVISSSSATETLLKKEEITVVRSSSLKEKAKSVARSVRGRRNTITVAA